MITSDNVFKTVEESIQMYKDGYDPDTDFEYVYNAEEVDFGDGEYQFNLNGDIDAQLKEITREYSSNLAIVEEGRQPFSEFTFTICPAYKA